MNPQFMTANREFNGNLLIYELAPDRSFENFPRAVRTVILDHQTKQVYINARISNQEKLEKIVRELEVVRAQEIDPPCHSLMVDNSLEWYVDVAWLCHALPAHAHYYSTIEAIFREEILCEYSH
jgi:hypothetical protein